MIYKLQHDNIIYTFNNEPIPKCLKTIHFIILTLNIY